MPGGIAAQEKMEISIGSTNKLNEETYSANDCGSM